MPSYGSRKIEIRQTTMFREWLDDLANRRAIERITQRIVRLQAGLIGDAKPAGQGISQLRIDHGPGYRLHSVQKGRSPIIPPRGADKKSQKRDIARAKTLAAELED